jgi:hypothetical protein
VTAVFRIPLRVYRLSLARWFCRRIPRALAAIKVTELVAIRPLSTFGRALCARPVHRLAMTAMLKSRGLSDLSLLRGVSIEATPFCFRSLAPHWEQVGRSSTQEN